MKLKLKVIDANATHVTVQIVEQEGFEPSKAYQFNGIDFASYYYPEYEAHKHCLCLQGRTTDRDNDQFSIPHEHWSQVFTAIEQLNAYVEPVKHTIVIDGKTIEISEESFNALKKSLFKPL